LQISPLPDFHALAQIVFSRCSR